MQTVLLATSDPRLWEKARSHFSPPIHWVIPFTAENLTVAVTLGWVKPEVIEGDSCLGMQGFHRSEGVFGPITWLNTPPNKTLIEWQYRVDGIVSDQVHLLPKLASVAHRETELLLSSELLQTHSLRLERRARSLFFKGLPPRDRPSRPRHVLIIGAGLAGAFCAWSLAQRGIRCTVLDAGPVPGSGASALYAGLLHPHWQANESPLFRLTRLGFHRMLSLLQRFPDCFEATGVLELAQDEQSFENDKAMVAQNALSMPSDMGHLVEAHFASNYSLTPQTTGGWWYPKAGIVKAGRLVRRLLEEANAQVLTNVSVSLRHQDGNWGALYGGEPIAKGDQVIVAAGLNSPSIVGLAEQDYALSGLYGRLSLIPESENSQHAMALTGRGYLVKSQDGFVAVGATYESLEEGIWSPQTAHEHNQALFSKLLPDTRAQLAHVGFYEGIRAVARDRMPLAGPALSRELVASTHFKGLPEVGKLPVETGLWFCCGLGSRGITWGLICAESVVADMLGETPVLEASLRRAIHPGRWIRHRLVA